MAPELEIRFRARGDGDVVMECVTLAIRFSRPADNSLARPLDTASGKP